jgi:hypothetical protein
MEFGEQHVHPVVVHGLAEFHGDGVEAVQRRLQRAERRLHVLPHGRPRIQRGFLCEIADAHAIGGPGLAAILGLDAGHDLQQGGLAGAVDAQHADLHAGQEGQGDALEHLAPAREGLGQVLHHIDVLVARHRSGSGRCVGQRVF